jgi:quercetin dioxygenase-like cupin family protein
VLTSARDVCLVRSSGATEIVMNMDSPNTNSNKTKVPEAAGDKMAAAFIANPVMVPGRRDFLKYRELGVTKASNGRIRAQVTSASQGLSEETGWHIHFCEGQFVYMLSGWVDLEFAGGEKIRIGAGDSMYIPGGTPHNETATSDGFELIEISVPADMGTEPCEAPD